jgi:uncharacterized protein YeaO (DUF488 family)
MPIRTRRWNDPEERGDSFRLLICRYRPRGLRKADETWDAWWKDLGPSRELHADFYGKHGPPIAWEEYRSRYLAEIRGQAPLIEQLAARVRRGETVTLLCSSACVDEEHCHRTLLKELIGRAVSR